MKPNEKVIVDSHIRNAVAAAKRKSVVLVLSQFAQRLRERCVDMDVDDEHILHELLLVAAARGVPIHFDAAGRSAA
jgi:hypothetical protein